MDNECPECGGPVDCVEVDIGVGVQYGPASCYMCGWTEGDDDVDDFLDFIENGSPF